MTKILSDSELAAIPPIEVGHNHQRNPFHDQLETTAGAANAKRWSRLHGWTVEERATVEGDPLAALDEELAILDAGWYRHEHPETGALILFPHTATDQNHWESRCQEMLDGQELIDLPDKPTENHYLRRPLHHSAEPVEPERLRFEDSEESRRVRGTARAD